MTTKPIIGSMRLGRWGANLRAQQVADLLHECVQLGLDELDLADIYGDYSTNLLLGEAMALRPPLRQQLKLILKLGIVLPAGTCYHYNTSAAALRTGIEQALQQLGVTRVDALLLHRFDHLLDPESLRDTLEPYLRSGQIGCFGASNCSAAQLAVLARASPLRVHQYQLSLHCHSALELHSATLALACKTLAWSPLAAGALLERRGNPALEKIVSEIASELALTPAQVCLRWVHTLPNTSAVIGTHRICRISEALIAAERPLSHAHWYALLEAAQGARLP